MNIAKDYKIILASASPRRRELLEQVGIEYECIPSDCEEITKETEPAKVVSELSRIKALDIAKQFEGTDENTIVIGADTVVSFGNEIMGKPTDEAHAFQMLKKLSGREHSVFTGVTLVIIKNGKTRHMTLYAETKVHVYPMKDEEILDYIKTGEPMDKAGAYAIQGMFSAFIEKIEGDYNNVVGLPVSRVCKILREV